jgi:hypothetical protein
MDCPLPDTRILTILKQGTGEGEAMGSLLLAMHLPFGRSVSRLTHAIQSNSLEFSTSLIIHILSVSHSLILLLFLFFVKYFYDSSEA